VSIVALLDSLPLTLYIRHMQVKSIIILIGILITVIGATYFGIRLVNKLSEPPRILPSPIPVISTKETQLTSGWLRYQAPQGLFSLLYPENYDLQELGGLTIFGRAINWFQLSDHLYSCTSPACPRIAKTESLTINNLPSIKYWGSYSDEDSGLEQSFIQYEIPLPSGQFLELRMSELPLDMDAASLQELYPDHKPGSISKDREEILNTMAASIKF